MSMDVSAGARATDRRFSRSAQTRAAEHRNRSSAVELLPPDRWEMRHGAVTDEFVLRDYDGKRIVKLNTSEHASKQRLGWRAPVSVAARGADGLWLYKGHTYRADRGLAWWDIEALVGDDGPGTPPPATPEQAVMPRRRNVNPAKVAAKTVTHLREHGLESTLAKVRQRVEPNVFLTETHVWSELDLTTPRPPRPLAKGLELVSGTVDDIPGASTVPGAVAPAEARRRLERGANLYLVKDGDDVAFVCWIFREAVPMIVAPNGEYRLPPNVAMLEDSLTNPTHRGRGVAPAAWTEIAASLASEGVTRLLTKVETENEPSRKAVKKAGFVEGAVVTLRRIGGYNRVHVETLESTRLANEIRARTD